MSSSFVDMVGLARTRQEELERKRKDRLRRIKELTAQFNQCVNQYESFGAHVSLSMKRELESLNKVDELRLACHSFRNTQTEIEEEIEKTLSTPLPSEPRDIPNRKQDMTRRLGALERAFNERISEFANLVSLYYKELLNSSNSQGAPEVPTKSEDLKLFECNVLLAGGQLSTRQMEWMSVERIIEECSLLALSGAIGRAEKKQIKNILALFEKANESADANGFRQVISQYGLIKGNIKRNLFMLDDKYATYCALYVEEAGLRKSQAEAPGDFIPRHQFVSMDELDRVIKKKEHSLQKENEWVFVKEILTEVMAQFGYLAPERIVPKGETEGRHYLFQSSGDRTPVYLYTSGGDGITIEAVSLGVLEEDGHPGYTCLVAAGDLPEQEWRDSYEAQSAFSDLHVDLAAELKKRGVVLTAIPQSDTKFVKKILIKKQDVAEKQGASATEVYSVDL